MDQFTDDVLLKISSYLRASELVCLALTCTRFGSKNNSNYNRSLVEEAAMKNTSSMKSLSENELQTQDFMRDRGPISIYHGLLLHRTPLNFRLLGRNIEYCNKNRSSVWNANDTTNTAICCNTMRSGKHYVTFKKHGYGRLNVGIMRPMKHEQKDITWFDPLERRCWDCMIVQPERDDRFNISCCMLCNNTGHCSFSDCLTATHHGNNWEGMARIAGNIKGDCNIGMCLDFNAGSLTVYLQNVNGDATSVWRRMGTMCRGLSGEFCWAVSIWKGTKVEIERGLSS